MQGDLSPDPLTITAEPTGGAAPRTEEETQLASDSSFEPQDGRGSGGVSVELGTSENLGIAHPITAGDGLDDDDLGYEGNGQKLANGGSSSSSSSSASSDSAPCAGGWSGDMLIGKTEHSPEPVDDNLDDEGMPIVLRVRVVPKAHGLQKTELLPSVRPGSDAEATRGRWTIRRV